MPKQTKVNIIEAFERILKKKKFESITVTQIVEECDINRKTFYYYFSDIDDLLEKAFDYELGYFVKSLPEGISIPDGVKQFFDFVSDNRDVIYHVANSSGIDNMKCHFYRTLYNFANTDILRRANGRNVTEEQLDIITNIYVHVSSGFIFQWLDEGMKTNPSEFLAELSKILDGSINLLLSNCEKTNG